MKIVIEIPESIGELLEKAFMASEELVIKTKDISLELSANGQLTLGQFKDFQLQKVEESTQQVQVQVEIKRPKEPQPLLIHVENKVEERREAILEVIKKERGKPLKMSTLASLLTKRGYACAPSTVSIDINQLLKSGRLSFYHERGSGRIYKIEKEEDFVF